MYYVLALAIAAGLAFIPASIARRKGYSFGLWWLYGWLIWIAAIIHVNCIPDRNAQQVPVYQRNDIQYSTPALNKLGVADELIKYKELMDKNVITKEEFKKKKEDLMKLV